MHCDDIVRGRLKTLVMGHPRILSSSIEKNLKPTVAFFLNECGLTGYEFGRIVYRRGGSLLEANVERTLKRKVSFLREKLGLRIDLDEEEDARVENISRDEQVDIPQLESIPTQQSSSSDAKRKLTNYEKKRLLAQMLATNPDILTLSIENNLQPKFDYFTQDIGFSIEELRYVLLKRPQLLSLSLERNIIPKIEYFLEPRSNDDDGAGSGGLGMAMNEVRPWLAKYPQTLAVVLESRIKPRVHDVTQMGLYIGSGDNNSDVDTALPLNFLTQSDRNWKKWKQDYLEEAAVRQ